MTRKFTVALIGLAIGVVVGCAAFEEFLAPIEVDPITGEVLVDSPAVQIVESIPDSDSEEMGWRELAAWGLLGAQNLYQQRRRIAPGLFKPPA